MPTGFEWSEEIREQLEADGLAMTQDQREALFNQFARGLVAIDMPFNFDGKADWFQLAKLLATFLGGFGDASALEDGHPEKMRIIGAILRFRIRPELAVRFGEKRHLLECMEFWPTATQDRILAGELVDVGAIAADGSVSFLAKDPFQLTRQEEDLVFCHGVRDRKLQEKILLSWRAEENMTPEERRQRKKEMRESMEKAVAACNRQFAQLHPWAP